MKNKHLVLIFLLALLAGLAVRQAPWCVTPFFQAELLTVDTAELFQMQIIHPAQTAFTVVRTESGWLAEQGGQVVPLHADVARQMLAALVDMRSTRIVKTALPDTLGFSPNIRYQVEILHANGQKEAFNIGLERMENGVSESFVQLPPHGGVYAVALPLRSIFTLRLLDFRSDRASRFDIASVHAFELSGKNLDSLSFVKADTLSRWESLRDERALPDESVRAWLSKISKLEGLPFARLFDEAHASELRFAQIKLQLEAQAEPLVLQVFSWGTRSIPEEMPAGQIDKLQFAPFILHSSQNPGSYFLLQDTFFVHKICQPF